ncbi:MAG TPA: Ku protein [Opitutaceae bacterium]|nr:Ku protein [Opitutaceae bacterium]
MRPIWKGSISFGLVTIPVQVLPATSAAEKISFRMLRKGDLSPIKYKRVAEVDDQEVPWAEIVKGYEYEKGQFVVFTDEDFDKVELESVDSIAIQKFVDLGAIDPIFFDKPYYIEPLKGGGPAYGLLRDVLAETGKVGIAKVAMRGRQHLAALKASGALLVLELMHFGTEITPAEGVKVPEGKLGAREKEMAKTLVDQMSGEWNPAEFTDEYAEALMKLIEKKVAAGGKELPGGAKKSPAAGTNVIDLVAVLQQSLSQGKSGRSPKDAPAKKTPKARAHKTPRHKHAA